MRNARKSRPRSGAMPAAGSRRSFWRATRIRAPRSWKRSATYGPKLIQLESGGRAADGGDEALFRQVDDVLARHVTATKLAEVHALRDRLGRGESVAIGVADIVDTLVRRAGGSPADRCGSVTRVQRRAGTPSWPEFRRGEGSAAIDTCRPGADRRGSSHRRRHQRGPRPDDGWGARGGTAALAPASGRNTSLGPRRRGSLPLLCRAAGRSTGGHTMSNDVERSDATMMAQPKDRDQFSTGHELIRQAVDRGRRWS